MAVPTGVKGLGVICWDPETDETFYFRDENTDYGWASVQKILSMAWICSLGYDTAEKLAAELVTHIPGDPTGLFPNGTVIDAWQLFLTSIHNSSNANCETVARHFGGLQEIADGNLTPTHQESIDRAAADIQAYARSLGYTGYTLTSISGASGGAYNGSTQFGTAKGAAQVYGAAHKYPAIMEVGIFFRVTIVGDNAGTPVSHQLSQTAKQRNMYQTNYCAIAKGGGTTGVDSMGTVFEIKGRRLPFISLDDTNDSDPVADIEIMVAELPNDYPEFAGDPSTLYDWSVAKSALGVDVIDQSKDLSDYYQDVAGLTPVVAVGDPVRRVNASTGDGFFYFDGPDADRPVTQGTDGDLTVLMGVNSFWRFDRGSDYRLNQDTKWMVALTRSPTLNNSAGTEINIGEATQRLDIINTGSNTTSPTHYLLGSSAQAQHSRLNKVDKKPCFFVQAGWGSGWKQSLTETNDSDNSFIRLIARDFSPGTDLDTGTETININGWDVNSTRGKTINALAVLKGFDGEQYFRMRHFAMDFNIADTYVGAPGPGVVTGDGAAASQNATASGSGSILALRTGDGTAQSQNATVAANGIIILDPSIKTGDGAAVSQDATVSADGIIFTPFIGGDGVAVSQAATVTADGILVGGGYGVALSQSATVAANGTVLHFGSGAAVSQDATVSARGIAGDGWTPVDTGPTETWTPVDTGP